MIWYLLLFVVPLGIAVYLVWDHRRKAAERAAISAERLSAILGATTHVPPIAGQAAAEVGSSDKVEPTGARAAAPAAPQYVARERVLSPPETLLYYLLKTGLPECHVFAQVALRAVLDAAPALSAYVRNEQARRLSWHAVDFLVCDRSLKPIAVVELARRDEPNGTAGSRQSWIGSAGLRYLSFESNALPKKEALRALVLGESPTEGPQSTAAAGS